MRDVLANAKSNPLWALAYVAALLLPFMLVVARAGIEVCGAIIILSFLWHSYRTRDWAWARTPFFRLSLVMWAWLVLVVTPLAYDPLESLREALAWMRFIALFMALRHWVFADAAPRRLAAMVVLSLIALIALDVLWQFIFGVSLSGNARPDTGRLTGPFHNPKAGLLMGKLVVVSSVITLMPGLAQGSLRNTAIPAALSMLVLVTLLITGDISATVATFFALGVIALGMMVKRPSWRVPCLAAGLGLALLAGTIYTTQPWVQARIGLAVERLSNYSQSDYGVITTAATAIARDHLLHGVGIQNFRDVSGKIAPYEGLAPARHPHNFYLEWWVEAGTPALLMFIGMVLLMLREAWRQWREAAGVAVLLPAAALGVTLQHFFPILGTQSNFNNWSSMLIWFSLGLMFSGLAREKAKL